MAEIKFPGSSRRVRVNIGSNRLLWPCVVVAVAFLAFGLTMILQHNRYENTPSYANLIKIADLSLWGGLYLTVSVLLLIYITVLRHEVFAIIAHTAAFILSTVWLVAFIVRYTTDNGTTIVNVVSWSVFTLLIIQSSLQIEQSSTFGRDTPGGDDLDRG